MDAFTAVFFEKLGESFTHLNSVIQELATYVRAHPEIRFEIYWKYRPWHADVLIKYSNGLKRRDHSFEDSQDVKLTFVNAPVKDERIFEFVDHLKTSPLTPEFKIKSWPITRWSIFTLLLRCVISNSTIQSIEELDDSELFKTLSEKKFLTCVCKSKTCVSALANYQISDERFKGLVDVAKNGHWYAFIPGIKNEFLFTCEGHCRCEYNTSGEYNTSSTSSECHGLLKLVTTYIDNDAAFGGRLHGSFYCEKHAPPGYKHNVYDKVGL